jgi:hypothetical protein
VRERRVTRDIHVDGADVAQLRKYVAQVTRTSPRPTTGTRWSCLSSRPFTRRSHPTRSSSTSASSGPTIGSGPSRRRSSPDSPPTRYSPKSQSYHLLVHRLRVFPTPMCSPLPFLARHALALNIFKPPCQCFS